MRDRLDRRVRAMRRAERIVHIDIGERGQRLRESRIVLFFLGMKPQVLEQHDAAGLLRFGDRLRDLLADAVFGEDDRPAQQLASRSATGRRLYLRVRLALRATEMDWRGSPSPPCRARIGSSAATPGCACRRRSRRSSAAR